jgi:hypothetical protein
VESSVIVFHFPMIHEHHDKLLSVPAGYGIVMSGLWKSMTPCAVKLVLTLDPARALQSQQSQVSAQSITTAEAQLMANAPILPSRALQEAVLARGLSHPNVIRT